MFSSVVLRPSHARVHLTDFKVTFSLDETSKRLEEKLARLRQLLNEMGSGMQTSLSEVQISKQKLDAKLAEVCASNMYYHQFISFDNSNVFQ